MIYFDYAATTPMSSKSLDIYNKVAKDYFGNPNSLHDIGAIAGQLLEKSRSELARFINGEARGIFFTGGGSDSNLLAIRSLLNGSDRKHIITTNVEHASLANLFIQLEKEGYEISYIPINEHGEIDLLELEKSIRPDTVLASIHHANPEIGTLQDLKRIGDLLDNHNVLFHTDCVQSFGKVEIDVKQFKITSLTISSHKIFGPKGVGACYIQPSVSWKPLLPNGTHEGGFRPGTVNVPGIAAFITAAEDMFETLEEEKGRIKKLRDQFLDGILNKGWQITVEGSKTNQLPHIIGLRVHGIEGQYTMLECNRYGAAISTGSACQVGQQTPSRSMTNIGRTNEEAKEFVRLSFSKLTTEEEIEEGIKIFNKFLSEHFK